MTMLNDLKNLSGGGDKLPVFRYLRVGDHAEGDVLRSAIVETTDAQTGKPRKSLVVDLQLRSSRGGIVTRDNDADGIPQTKVTDFPAGERVTMWLNPGFGIGAVRDALTAAGVDALNDGGVLRVELVEKRDVGKQSPANVFAARYTPPKGGVTADDLV